MELLTEPLVKFFLSLEVSLELHGYDALYIVAIRRCALQIPHELHLFEQLLSELSLRLILLVQLDQRFVQFLNQSSLGFLDRADLSEELLFDPQVRVSLASYESVGELVFLGLREWVFRLGCLHEFSQRVGGEFLVVSLLLTFDLLLRFLEDFHVRYARIVDDFLERAV